MPVFDSLRAFIRNAPTARFEEPLPTRPSAWPLFAASLLFSGMTFVLFGAYSSVHWGVLFGHHHRDLPADVQEAAARALGFLETYHFMGLAAVVFAVWGLAARPRWPVLISGGLAVLAGNLALMLT